MTAVAHRSAFSYLSPDDFKIFESKTLIVERNVKILVMANLHREGGFSFDPSQMEEFADLGVYNGFTSAERRVGFVPRPEKACRGTDDMRGSDRPKACQEAASMSNLKHLSALDNTVFV